MCDMRWKRLKIAVWEESRRKKCMTLVLCGSVNSGTLPHPLNLPWLLLSLLGQGHSTLNSLLCCTIYRLTRLNTVWRQYFVVLMLYSQHLGWCLIEYGRLINIDEWVNEQVRVSFSWPHWTTWGSEYLRTILWFTVVENPFVSSIWSHCERQTHAHTLTDRQNHSNLKMSVSPSDATAGFWEVSALKLR